MSRTNVYVYDALNRLTQTIFADNSTNTTVYDGVGRVQYSIDARGMSNAFGYDVAGQQVAVTNGFGTSISNVMWYAYDANGNRTVTTDIMGRSMTSVYDPLNRVVTNLFADGTFTVTVYDVLGRKSSQTDQATNTTWFGYDSLGRLICVTNALQQVTRYGYDEAGNQTNQMDALNRQTTYEYDALGRRIKRTLPGGQSESYGYDALGNQVYYTNFNGVVITNQYDVVNRLTNRSSVGGVLAAFTYTPTGQRQSMNDVSGLTTYAYDVRDRLITNATPEGTLYYGYDANGNVTNITSSTVNGTALSYQYDPLNRLTNVLANGNLAAGYGFDAVGNLQTLHYGNGVTNQYQYDALNRLTNLVWATNGSTLASFAYQLAASGNRNSLIESIHGSTVVNRTNQWQYDPTYRLTNETIIAPTTGSLTYGFDAVGNRLTRSYTGGLGLPTQTFSYNTNDWITNDLYDANGNTTNSASVAYQYDVENRLNNAGNGAVVIVYNGDGQRVSKTVGGMTTLFLVDTHNPSGYAQVLEELNVGIGTTNLARAYTYGMSLINQRLIGTSTNYYGLDGHGSVRFLLSTNGVITDTYTYDSYGILIASTGSTPNRYLYCAEQYDSDLGMYYLRARYYQPATGRFWTMDTFEGDQEDPLSLHKYLYCRNNPVNRIDPSGHDGDLVSLLTTISIVVNLGNSVNHAINHQYGLATLDLLGAVSGGFGLAGGLGLLEDALPPALSYGGAAASYGLSAAQLLQGVSVVISGTDLIIAMSGQDHHIMTDKNRISTAPNGEGPYTPKFEELIEGTNIKLSSDENIVEDLLGHSGKHPQANKYTYDFLVNTVKGISKGTPEYEQALLDGLKKLGKEAETQGSTLNTLLTARP